MSTSRMPARLCCGRSILGAIFWLWQRSEGTLSIHSITTQRREAYYWATVFATFALGTALGDFTATSLNLGYLDSGILFAVVILIPAVAHWKLGLNGVAAFWMSYIVTRPLGASFADYISKPKNLTGLNFGDGPTALVFAGAVLRAGRLSRARAPGHPEATRSRHGTGALGASARRPDCGRARAGGRLTKRSRAFADGAPKTSRTAARTSSASSSIGRVAEQALSAEQPADDRAEQAGYPHPLFERYRATLEHPPEQLQTAARPPYEGRAKKRPPALSTSNLYPRGGLVTSPGRAP